MLQARHALSLAALLATLTAVVPAQPPPQGALVERPSPSPSGAVRAGSRALLAILESTDLHSNVLSYDYFKLAEDDTLGLERMATLVKQARAEFPNTLLFDAGDTIQGTALADFEALTQPVACNRQLAVYKAMDALGYDGGTIGNHEFNYGLAHLSRVTGTPFRIDGLAAESCTGPRFPLVLANVVSTQDGRPLYRPTEILTRRIAYETPDGRTATAELRVGIIGFTPPLIMSWDRRHLAGKVAVKGLVEAAREHVPELRARGADLVVAISHGGLSTTPYSPTMENANWHLAQVPGIDAILLGHSHDVFPNPGDAKSRFAHMEGVDNERGTVNGVPAVMANAWGKSLGVVRLALRHDGKSWRVEREQSRSEVRSIKGKDGSSVPADPEIRRLVAEEHAAAIAYVQTPIGETDYRLASYFAELGDSSTQQVVNMAQLDYARRYVEASLPQHAALPVLSAAAPFKAGHGGPRDYTDIPPGSLTIASAADLYLYPNTLAVVKVNGAGLLAWLEKSAGRFNRIDPALKDEQPLLNRRFPSYNFDVLQGDLRYEIDVTQPEGRRIRDLRHRGQPVDPAREFLVVTNNYRASGGGSFPGLDGSSTILLAPDANRDVLIEYIRTRRRLLRDELAADRNWRFARVATAGPVTFVSAVGKLELAREAGLAHVSLLRDNGDGTATYAVDLGR